MTDQATQERDYFTDLSLLVDPYEYFEDLRARGPVVQLTSRDALMVTGFEESLEVLRNADDFSSVLSVPSGAYPLPFEPEGSDVSAQIEATRHLMPGADSLVTFDGSKHVAARAILNRLLTPTRLKANAIFMTNYAEMLVRDAVTKGQCEIINEIATPYVTLVIADLLGVPEEDRDLFRAVIDAAPPPGNMNDENEPTNVHPLEYMAGFFVRYIEDRRANPREDILTDLAMAKFPDGSMPTVLDVVNIATFLFGAGQDTSAKLLGNSMRRIAGSPELQTMLRENRALIGPFMEEVLRLEGSSKITARLARRDTKIGDIAVPAGKKIIISLAAANRDPRRWPDPETLKLDRPKAKEHVAFGRGAHVCAGAPLARAEIAVILDRFLDYAADIRFDEEKHGKPGAVRLDYEPSFIVRGLAELHLVLEPSGRAPGQITP